MGKGPFKMKGSPMQRNFGIGVSPMKDWKTTAKAVAGTVGDIVKSYDTENKEIINKKVTETFIHENASNGLLINGLMKEFKKYTIKHYQILAVLRKQREWLNLKD